MPTHGDLPGTQAGYWENYLDGPKPPKRRSKPKRRNKRVAVGIASVVTIAAVFGVGFEVYRQASSRSVISQGIQVHHQASSPSVTSQGIPVNHQASSPSVTSQGITSCTLGMSEDDTAVVVSDSSQSCGWWINTLQNDTEGDEAQNDSNSVWQGVSGISTSLSVVCVLDGQGNARITVYDDGGELYGSHVCNDEGLAGWMPDAPAEISAESAQSNANAEANVQASAQAAQQQAQSNLAGDAQTLVSASSSLSDDITQYKADLKTAQQDYQRVSMEPLCSAGSSDQNTYADAQNVHADGQDVSADETNVTIDLESLQRAYSQMQTDVAGAAIGGTQYATDMTNAQSFIEQAQAIGTAHEGGTIQSEASQIQAQVYNASC